MSDVTCVLTFKQTMKFISYDIRLLCFFSVLDESAH